MPTALARRYGLATAKVGRLTKSVVVPESPGGGTHEAFDLGTLELKPPE